MLNILKIKTLIDARGRKEYLVATFSMFIASIIEALGIGFIAPLIKLLNGNPNLISNLFPNINPQNNSILIFSGIFIIICFIVKSLILTFNSYQYFQFSYKLQTDISKKIFQKYLESADIFIDKNKMIANIYNECEKLTHLVIIPLTVITAEITIVILLFLILIFNSLNLTFLALIIFSISYYLYNNLTKNYINKIGKLREYSDFRKISELQKSLSQLMEIRLYNVVGLRVKEYENYALTSANSNAMNGVISGLPRIFMETLVVIIVIFYCGFSIIFLDIPIQFLVPEITIFTIIGFRLLPSLNRISNAKSNLQYASTIIENIYTTLNHKENENNNKKNISKNFKYSDNGTLKLNNLTSYFGFKDIINYEFNPGDVVSIDGISGKGKTTFFNILMGFVAPKNGIIKYCDIDITNDLSGYRSYISYVPQKITILDRPLYENITFQKQSKTIDKRYEEVCMLVNIDWISDFYCTSDLVNLSAGQIQRVAIARALYHKRKILLLDEPTSALDYENSQKILKRIINNSKELILIIITHDLNVKNLCNKHIAL